MRPPEPRREAARYIAWLRAAQTMFSAHVHARVGHGGALGRNELENEWARVTEGALPLLESIARNVSADDRRYWQKLAKRRPVPVALNATAKRAAWVRTNLDLIVDVGAKQIDELLTAQRELPRTDAREPKRVTEARKANVALISGTDLKQHVQLIELFKGAQAKGARHETLVERVQAITGAGDKRAKLIARDQTVKHNAVVRQETARSLGITQYVWRTSGDEAVRPHHKKLNGKTFSYADPPVTDAYGHTNNPGEDYSCRCVDEPVVDLFAGLDGPDLSGSLKAQGKLNPRKKP